MEARSIETARKRKSFDALFTLAKIDGKGGPLLPQWALGREYCFIANALTGCERRDVDGSRNVYLWVVANKKGLHVL